MLLFLLTGRYGLCYFLNHGEVYLLWDREGAFSAASAGTKGCQRKCLVINKECSLLGVSDGWRDVGLMK